MQHNEKRDLMAAILYASTSAGLRDRIGAAYKLADEMLEHSSKVQPVVPTRALTEEEREDADAANFEPPINRARI